MSGFTHKDIYSTRVAVIQITICDLGHEVLYSCVEATKGIGFTKAVKGTKGGVITSVVEGTKGVC